MRLSNGGLVDKTLHLQADVLRLYFRDKLASNVPILARKKLVNLKRII